MGLPVLVEHHNITHGHRPHPTPEGARVLVMTGEKSFEAGALAKHPGIDVGVVGHGDTAFCLLVLSETVVRVQICLIDLVVVRYASLRGIDAAVALHKSGKLQQMIDGAADFGMGIVDVRTGVRDGGAVEVGHDDAGVVREREDFVVGAVYKADAVVAIGIRIGRCFTRFINAFHQIIQPFLFLLIRFIIVIVEMILEKGGILLCLLENLY